MRTAIIVLALCFAANAGAATLYVDQDATGANDGTSWADAWTDLQDALLRAASGDQVWIAEGAYRPSSTPYGFPEFRVPSGVQLYGGFAGTEIALDERDPSTWRTVLSGDLGEQRPAGVDWDPAELWARDNAVRLVLLNATDGNTLLDGLELSESGRALDIVGGAPRITNCTVRWNSGNGQGIGALVHWNSNPVFEDVVFERNLSAQRAGGGVAADGGSSPTFVRVVFRDNSAALHGGGMSGSGSFTDVRFVGNRSSRGGGLAGGGHFNNVSFEDNEGGMYGGGLWSAGGLTGQNLSFTGNQADEGAAFYLGYAPGTFGMSKPASRFVNVTIAGNSARSGAVVECNAADMQLVSAVVADPAGSVPATPFHVADAVLSLSHSLVQGSGGSGATWNPSFGTDLGGNLDSDAGFVGGGDFRLAAGAPGIDAGDSAALAPGTTTDLDGNPRISGPCVDMGAWEFQAQAEPGNTEGLFAGQINPRSLNLRSQGRFVSLTLVALDGTPVDEIDVQTLRLQDALAPEPGRAHVEDDTLEVKFNREAFVALLEPAPTVVVEVSGMLLDGTGFELTDEIRLVGIRSAAASSVRVFPNPFNPATTIRFAVERTMHVQLEIYDLSGRRVRTLLSGMRAAGEYAERWDGTDASGRGVASGTYFARLRTEDFETVGRLVLVK